MVKHVFDNSNLSQEIFAIDTCGAHAHDPYNGANAHDPYYGAQASEFVHSI